MSMIMINIHEAKARLSEFLEAAARGEQVLICNRNRPVAELRALPDRTGVRDFTPAYPDFAISPEFFELLPDDELDAFEGGAVELPKMDRGRTRAVPKRGSAARQERGSAARHDRGSAARHERGSASGK